MKNRYFIVSSFSLILASFYTIAATPLKVDSKQKLDPEITRILTMPHNQLIEELKKQHQKDRPQTLTDEQKQQAKMLLMQKLQQELLKAAQNQQKSPNTHWNRHEKIRNLLILMGCGYVEPRAIKPIIYYNALTKAKSPVGAAMSAASVFVSGKVLNFLSPKVVWAAKSLSSLALTSLQTTGITSAYNYLIGSHVNDLLSYIDSTGYTQTLKVGAGIAALLLFIALQSKNDKKVTA